MVAQAADAPAPSREQCGFEYRPQANSKHMKTLVNYTCTSIWASVIIALIWFFNSLWPMILLMVWSGKVYGPKTN